MRPDQHDAANPPAEEPMPRLEPLIGEARVTGLARDEIDHARRDPRLGHGPDAPFGDFLAAVAEAARLRRLSEWGLHELARSLEREEIQLGVRAGVADEAHAPALQAAWERAALARAEIENGFPYLNGVALISLHAALDDLVERLVPLARTLLQDRLLDRALTHADAEVPDALAQLEPEQLEAVHEAIRETIASMLLPDTGKRNRKAVPRGAGADRYEPALALAYLAARPNRPIPRDMDLALKEIAGLRNVLVHRGGRIDAAALRDAPTLRYAVGDLVRIQAADFRRYSAAVRTYAHEVAFRLMGPTLVPAPDLDRWAMNYLLNE